MAITFKRALNDAGVPSNLMTVKKLCKHLTKNFNPDCYIGLNVIAGSKDIDQVEELWILNPNAFKTHVYNGVKCVTLTDLRIRHSLPTRGSAKLPKPAADSVGCNSEEILQRFNARYDYDIKELTKYYPDAVVDFMRDTLNRDLSELIKLKADFDQMFGDKTNWDFKAPIKQEDADNGNAPQD